MSAMVERLNGALEGRYGIERELGQGGMATVYLAEDVKHRRKVALKVLKPELAAVVGSDRFLAEIETTANLQHPHILPLYDSGEADGFLFYVMPYVEGESLREKLQREGELPVDEAVSLVVDVAEALDYAHRQGVVHRDIKPANILMQEGRPLLADFGIALAVSAAGGGRMTETGLSLGTPHYMSPEQATADRAPGPTSDVYSLSCVLYEMLTGRTPFPGPSAQAVLGQIISGRPAPPTEHRRTIPAHVNAAVVRGLERLPADRFRSTAELARALEDPGYRYGAGRDAAVSDGRWRALALAASVVAVLGLAFAGWSTWRPDPERPITRYRLGLPEGQSPATTSGIPVTRLALSPDGRRVAFLGGSSGPLELWLLDRDQLDPQRVAVETGDAFSPFFSPDGTALGYFSDAGDLRVVSIPGGGSRTLAFQASNLGGADWAPDGYIYFNLQATPDHPAGIGRVPEIGGAIELVAVADTAAGELNYFSPQLLPDGRTLLFVVTTSSGAAGQLFALDLETRERTDLGVAVRARYVDPGYLLWARPDGSLLAARFDMKSRTLAPGAITLVQDVAVTGANADFAVSHEGTLLYATGTGGALGEPMWVERNGTARPIEQGWEFPVNNFFQSVALSPDDRQLVVSIQGGSLDLWVKELDTGPLSRLTFAGPNFRARWFPEGGRVLFGTDRGAGQELWAKRTDGTGDAVPLPAIPISNQGDLGPDGDWVAFRFGRDLKAARLSQPEAEPVDLVTTSFDELAPAISRDGRWFAYVSNETGRDEVYVRPFPDPSGGRWQISTSGGTEPVWSRDGRELYYRDGQSRLVAVQLLPGETFRTGSQEPLFSTSEYWANRFQRIYDVASDGRFIFLRRGDVASTETIVIVENFMRDIEERLDR